MWIRVLRWLTEVVKVWWVACDEFTQAALRILGPVALLALSVERWTAMSWPAQITHPAVYLAVAILGTATLRQSTKFWDPFRKIVEQSRKERY